MSITHLSPISTEQRDVRDGIPDAPVSAQPPQPVATMRGWALLAAQLAQAPIGFITTIGPEDWHTEGLAMLAAAPLELNHAQRAVADALARHVAAQCDVMIVPDTARFWCGATTPPALARIRAAAAVPIFTPHDLSARAVIGALDTTVRHWSHRHQDGLWTLAAAASITLIPPRGRS